MMTLTLLLLILIGIGVLVCCYLVLCEMEDW